MKKILISLLITGLVVSCGGGKGSKEVPPPPAPPPVVEPPPPPPPPEPEPEVVFNVKVVKAVADYWDPAVIEVEYTIDGIPQPVEYMLPEGYYFETPEGIEVFSNGQLGDHQILINDEEYQIRFEDMPVCVGTEEGLIKIDCVGLRQGGGSDWYIYYGEDDQRIVEWEVVYVGLTAGDGYVNEPSARLLEEAESTIAWVNEQYARSGVYVRLKLVQVVGTPNPNGSFDPQRLPEGYLVDSDILAISGALPSGICGYAGQSNSFRDRVSPLRPLFGCGGASFIHELGHTVGLGHGENGGVNSGRGSTFFAFAEGSGMCGFRSDWMQYGGGDKALTNHKLTCREQGFTGSQADNLSGSLEWGSTAYAINRVRYDVALVHDEFAKEPVAFVEETCRKEQRGGVWYDCYGYEYGGASQSLTWYGEADRRMATITLGLVRNGGVQGEVITDPAILAEFQSWVDQMNEVNLNSGVWIHFVAADVAYWAGSCYGIDQVPRGLHQGTADIVVGWCPGPTAGGAYIQRSFVPGQRPPAARAGAWLTALHEIGHVMGLGHGIWSGGATQSGSFFMGFGHGWSDRTAGICRTVDSLMSYGNRELGWSNSKLTCSQVQKNPGAFGDARGLRGPRGTDEAYALNRVRWNVSRVSPL